VNGPSARFCRLNIRICFGFLPGRGFGHPFLQYFSTRRGCGGLLCCSRVPLSSLLGPLQERNRVHLVDLAQVHVPLRRRQVAVSRQFLDGDGRYVGQGKVRAKAVTQEVECPGALEASGAGWTATGGGPPAFTNGPCTAPPQRLEAGPDGAGNRSDRDEALNAR
jgi:hypothetical protein